MLKKYPARLLIKTVFIVLGGEKKTQSLKFLLWPVQLRFCTGTAISIQGVILFIEIDKPIEPLVGDTCTGTTVLYTSAAYSPACLEIEI